MIEIKFTGNDFNEVRLEIQKFSIAHLNAKFDVGDGNKVDLASSEMPRGGASPTSPVPLKDGEPEKKKGKPGRKFGWRKNAIAELKPQAPLNTKLVAAQSAIREIVADSRYGFNKAEEILASFNVSKVSELPDEELPKLTEVCGELLRAQSGV